MAKSLDREHFEQTLQDVLDQVFEGKGKQRHGHGDGFDKQPWRHITDNVGVGFLEGQALKKIMELRSLTSLSAYKHEVLGAIVYLVMAIMYREYCTVDNNGSE